MKYEFDRVYNGSKRWMNDLQGVRVKLTGFDTVNHGIDPPVYTGRTSPSVSRCHRLTENPLCS